MNIDDRLTTNDLTNLRAHSHILQKFQTAITLQRVNLSHPIVFDSTVGFSGTAVGSNTTWRRPPSWKTSSGRISETHYPSDSLYVCTQTILCPL